jgi:hypothetical protein
MQLLLEHLSTNGAAPEDDEATFLLAEFAELGQFWRHTDSRIENGINYYLTASVAATSAIAYISRTFA